MDKAFIKNPVEAYEKLKEENKKLKAENKKLKQFENDANDILKKQLDLFDKKEQALEEIKEIAEEDCKQCFEIDGFSKPDDCGICPYNKILLKISEVLE